VVREVLDAEDPIRNRFESDVLDRSAQLVPPPAMARRVERRIEEVEGKRGLGLLKVLA